MKEIILYNPFRAFLAIIIFISCCMMSACDKDLFLQGNVHFLQGQFEQARHCYENISQKNSAVWHNIGNCYFNEKNNIKALICWKRAECGATFGQLGQLFEVERVVLEQYNCPRDGVFVRSTKRIVFGVSSYWIQFLLIILLLLFLILWNQSVKKKYLLWLFFWITILLFFLVVKQKLRVEKQAVVTGQKSSMYVGPEITFSEKALLPQGSIVQVVDSSNATMVKVLSLQGLGWIVRDNVEII